MSDPPFDVGAAVAFGLDEGVGVVLAVVVAVGRGVVERTGVTRGGVGEADVRAEEVGVRVGDADALAVEVGVEVGTAVGVRTGVAVGTAVGAVVGTAVGSVVGDAVTSGVEEGVGDSVGSSALIRRVTVRSSLPAGILS